MKADNTGKLPRSNYYEGVLQLRDLSSEMLEFVHSQIRKEGVAITQTVRHDQGVDLYISSQRFLRQLGRKLNEIYGGELKMAAKLHTRNRQGRDLYRVNVFFRPPKHREGDIVNVRGSKIKLVRIGVKIFGKDMGTGKKVTIRKEDLP